MGRRRGSRNKVKIEGVEQPVDNAVKQETEQPEAKKMSFMERYNRPLPFAVRQFCFGANYERT